MGYDIITFSGSVRLSRHNSSQDNDDNERWNELCLHLTRLEAKYADIGLTIQAHEINDYPRYGD